MVKNKKVDRMKKGKKSGVGNLTDDEIAALLAERERILKELGEAPAVPPASKSKAKSRSSSSSGSRAKSRSTTQSPRSPASNAEVPGVFNSSACEHNSKQLHYSASSPSLPSHSKVGPPVRGFKCDEESAITNTSRPQLDSFHANSQKQGSRISALAPKISQSSTTGKPSAIKAVPRRPSFIPEGALSTARPAAPPPPPEPLRTSSNFRPPPPPPADASVLSQNETVPPTHGKFSDEPPSTQRLMMNLQPGNNASREPSETTSLDSGVSVKTTALGAKALKTAKTSSSKPHESSSCQPDATSISIISTPIVADVTSESVKQELNEDRDILQSQTFKPTVEFVSDDETEGDDVDQKPVWSTATVKSEDSDEGEIVSDENPDPDLRISQELPSTTGIVPKKSPRSHRVGCSSKVLQRNAASALGHSGTLTTNTTTKTNGALTLSPSLPSTSTTAFSHSTPKPSSAGQSANSSKSNDLVAQDAEKEAQSSPVGNGCPFVQSSTGPFNKGSRPEEPQRPGSSSGGSTPRVDTPVGGDGDSINDDVIDMDLEEEEEWESEIEIDVESMLEDSRQEALEKMEKSWQGREAPTVREKRVLKNKRRDYFEVLPDGWVEVTHTAGIPVYLHKATRVCTMSRPYFIGPGSVRHHDVPASAIPCYYQLKLKEWDKEKKLQAAAQLAKKSAPSTPRPAGGDNTGGKTSLESGFKSGSNLTAGDSGTAGQNGQNFSENGDNEPSTSKENSDEMNARLRVNLNADSLHDYCQKRFEFQTIKVFRFGNWADHRSFHKRKRMQRRRPGLPKNVKLIAVPKKDGSKQGEVYLNPHGKTSVALLHEYVQRVMHASADYELGQTNSAAQPYSATVYIEGTRYSTGFGNNKRQAKLDAAKKTLAVLVPDVDFAQDATVKLPNEHDVLALFDLFSITDSRVFELSVKAGQPSPYQILMECLNRNATFGDTVLNSAIALVKHQQHEYTLTVGKGDEMKEVKVRCSNKKEGKQKASQHMLAKLHPHLKTWGSLLRLYGFGTQRGLKMVSSKGGPGGPTCSFGPNSLPPRAPPQQTRGPSGGKNGPSKQEDEQQQPIVQQILPKSERPPNRAILDKLYKEMKRLFEDETKSGTASTREKTESMERLLALEGPPPSKKQKR